MASKKFKLYFGKAIAGVLAGLTAIAVMAGCSNPKETLSADDAQETYPLLSQEVVMGELESQHGQDQDVFSGQDFSRLPSSVEAPSTLVNVNFEANDRQKELLEFCIKEYNDVFEFVNDKYSFELNYDASKEERDNPYAINIGVADLESGLSTSSKTSQDLSENIDGNESYFASIVLDEKTAANDKTFMHAFKHEFAKVLGLEISQEEGGRDSIMRNNLNYTSLSSIDMSVLYSLYRSPEKVYDNTLLYDFMSAHTGYDYQSFYANKISASLTENFETLKKKLEKNFDYDLAKLDNLCEKISSGEFDKTFGEGEANFTSKVKKLDYFIPYIHTSVKDGVLITTRFTLNGEMEPSVLSSKQASYTNHDGMIISQDESQVTLAFKVDDLVLTLVSPISQDGEYDKVVSGAQALVYDVSQQGYEEYSRNLSEQCKAIYSSIEQ